MADYPGFAFKVEHQTTADPACETAAVAHAEAAVLSGDLGEARRVLVTLIEKSPNAIRGRCLLGEIELTSMRPREARKHFDAVPVDDSATDDGLVCVATELRKVHPRVASAWIGATATKGTR